MSWDVILREVVGLSYSCWLCNCQLRCSTLPLSIVRRLELPCCVVGADDYISFVASQTKATLVSLLRIVTANLLQDAPAANKVNILPLPKLSLLKSFGAKGGSNHGCILCEIRQRVQGCHPNLTTWVCQQQQALCWATSSTHRVSLCWHYAASIP